LRSADCNARAAARSGRRALALDRHAVLDARKAERIAKDADNRW
jgi:hypothetical protein